MQSQEGRARAALAPSARAVPARARIVIAHDYLTQRGGAERVVLAMSRTFPEAAIFTALYQSDRTFPELASKQVVTSVLQRSRLLRNHHRLGLPLYAPVFSSTTLDADLVLCSTSGWAHGVRATGRRLLYVHNTARWLYQTDDYLRSKPAQARRIAEMLGKPLRRWDRAHGAPADVVLANSEAVRIRLARHWQVDAKVLYPPHAADPGARRTPLDGIEPGFLLSVGRLVDHKRLDVLLAALQRRPDLRLVVVGEGPRSERLRTGAPVNCRFVGRLSEPELAWCYASAVAFVSVSHEDLGLAAIEAMAFGRPVAVVRSGGFLETVVEGETGIFFDRAEPDAVARAVDQLLSTRWDPQGIAAHAARFDEASFARQLRSIAEELMAQ